MGMIAANSFVSTFTSLVKMTNDIFTLDSAAFDSLTTTPNYSFVNALRQTLFNMVDILDGSLFLYGLNTVTTNLEQIQSIGLPITVQDNNYLSTRTNGMNQVISDLNNQLIASTLPASALVNGSPIITETNYLTYMATLQAEVPPSNVSGSVSIYPTSTDEASGWIRIQTILNASNVSVPANLSDTLGFMAQIQSYITTFGITYTPLSVTMPVSTLWNYSVCLPIYQDMSSTYYNDPSNSIIQAAMVLRYSLKQAELTCSELLAAFANQTNNVGHSATLLQGQSLMDFANKNLGDASQWQLIATINGLLPPYVSQTPGPNVATPGQLLLLPGATVPNTNPGTYLINFLGSDLNLGPPQGSMPAWSGDFQTVNGYTNLRWALARRVLTPLGSFIYHPDYGSYLASYMGNPLSVPSLQLVLSYVQTALLSDPRVAKILNLTPTVGTNALGIAATVQPAGQGLPETVVDFVLQPGPVQPSPS